MVSPILAENVVRAVVRRTSLKFAHALLATAALWMFDHPFSAIMTSPFAIAWLVGCFATQLVIRQFDNIRCARATSNWMCINGRKLYAPGRVWAKASSLPTAGLE